MLEYYNLVGNTSQKLPQDFLIEMMEINESIMDLKFEFDAIKQSEIIKKIKELSQNFEQHIHHLSREFDKINPILSENRRDVLNQLNDIYLKQKYVLRLQESLNTFRSALNTQAISAAQMAELVDASVSNTDAARRAGSTPALGTEGVDQKVSSFFYEN